MVFIKNLVDTKTLMNSAINARRRRRTHTASFKAQVIQACAQPGVSIAAIALAHGLNANLVRRWMNGRDLGRAAGRAAPVQLPAVLAQAQCGGAFVPLQLEPPHALPAIRLELRRGAASVVVNWPAQEAAACSTWLLAWLR